MTEVHVIYTGIVGFVRTQSGIMVVVQDAKGHPDHPHVPHVVIEAGAFEGFQNLTDLGTHNRLRGFLLERYAINVGGTIEEATLSEDANFQQFVLVLERGCPANAPGCGGILRHVLGGPVPNSVAARMALPHGRLETTYVDPYDQWQFEGLGGSPVHLAEEMCLMFHISDPVLRLNFAKNSGAAGSLQVKVPKNEKTIEVRIGNLPEDLVFYPTREPVSTDDEHVKLYYDLSALPPSTRRALIYSKDPTPLPDVPQTKHTHRLTPEPIQTLAKSEQSLKEMVHGPNCPPALWS